MSYRALASAAAEAREGQGRREHRAAAATAKIQEGLSWQRFLKLGQFWGIVGLYSVWVQEGLFRKILKLGQFLGVIGLCVRGLGLSDNKLAATLLVAARREEGSTKEMETTGGAPLHIGYLSKGYRDMCARFKC